MLAHKYKRPTSGVGHAVEFGDADIVEVTDGVCDERTFADYGYGYRLLVYSHQICMHVKLVKNSSVRGWEIHATWL